MRRTEALKIITRVLKQPVDDVPAADVIYGRALAHLQDPNSQAPNPWAIQVDVLAMRIAAQLSLTDDAEQQNPVAQAEDAKRRRDLEGEISVLMSAGADLESAPWAPVRPGDLVHVHHEAGPLADAFGETYIVAAGAHGFLSMQLLAHTLPEDTEFLEGMVGCFAVEDDPDPLMELWFEVGAHRLTIVRDGRPVHIGPAR